MPIRRWEPRPVPQLWDVHDPAFGEDGLPPIIMMYPVCDDDGEPRAPFVAPIPRERKPKLALDDPDRRVPNSILKEPLVERQKPDPLCAEGRNSRTIASFLHASRAAMRKYDSTSTADRYRRRLVTFWNASTRTALRRLPCNAEDSLDPSRQFNEYMADLCRLVFSRGFPDAASLGTARGIHERIYAAVSYERDDDDLRYRALDHLGYFTHYLVALLEMEAGINPGWMSGVQEKADD